MVIYRIIFATLVAQLIISCQLNKSITYINDDIDKDIRKEIATLNTTVFNEAKNNSIAQIENLLHSKFREIENYQSIIKSLINFLHSNNALSSISTYNEFYCISPGSGERQVHFFSFTDDNFFVSLTSWTPEIYVSLYEAKNFGNDVLISLVYEKENGKWKIRNFHIGERRNFGRTFHQWIAEAYNDYKNSKYFSAFIKILGAQSMLKPAPFMEYVLADSIKSMINELTDETYPKESFAIKFNDIKSKPEIYSIRHQHITDVKEILPVFNYRTNYSLEAVDSLESEIDIMAVKLRKKFPGIEEQFSAILFCATKEIPSIQNKNFEFYNLVYKFN